ncbi:Beta-galactosidase 8 [Hibiscus syriacus]|uniref:Beta-galactosidase 8 n=1 Tax=Hibiscus syriacus TaxID=106335 RepID=A0A6A3CNA9_HIBSY|nr:Beta-galactosidase 8 [Hibiscus syriacus]
MEESYRSLCSSKDIELDGIFGKRQEKALIGSKATNHNDKAVIRRGSFHVYKYTGNEEKLAVCKKLGADVCINYKTEDFVARVKEETGGKGVDVILDCIGAAYLQRNLDSLNFDGRLCIIGLQSGTVAEIKLNTLLPRRLTVQGAGMRARTPENKAMVVNEVEKNVWPEVVAVKLKPIIYKSFPLSEAGEGHKLMESNEHIGKILLVP